MFAKSYIAMALTVGLLGTAYFVPTASTAKDSEVARPTCCMKNAYCCKQNKACCGSSATSVAVNQTAARPTCCMKNAYCCKQNKACCGNASVSGEVVRLDAKA